MAMSHAACDHDKTPKARAVCRSRQRQHDVSTTSLSETVVLGWGPIPAPVIESPKIEGLTIVRDAEGRGIDAIVTPELIKRTQAKVNRRGKRTDPALRVADRRLSEIREAANQPTWDGARKAARKAAMAVLDRPLLPSADGVDYSHCVQADLHRGGGRCACGWRA